MAHRLFHLLVFVVPSTSWKPMQKDGPKNASAVLQAAFYRHRCVFFLGFKITWAGWLAFEWLLFASLQLQMITLPPLSLDALNVINSSFHLSLQLYLPHNSLPRQMRSSKSKGWVAARMQCGDDDHEGIIGKYIKDWHKARHDNPHLICLEKTLYCWMSFWISC